MKVKVNILGIFARYSLLILSALFNLWIFYFIFTPLTIYPVYAILNYFLGALLNGNNIILISGNTVGIMEMIPACIAGAAYFLLFILNMSVPNIKLKKRIKLILISFLSLLVLNIIRIIILGTLLISGSSLFEITHQIFWYVLSTVFVVGIWFAEVKIFKIKDIPVFSDIKSLIHLMKKTRKSKRSNRH